MSADEPNAEISYRYMVSSVLFILQFQVHAAECEIADLNAEFEFERIDYLDTIRKQEKQLALYQQLLEKVQPVLRRDCNYYNLDKVSSQSVIL